MIPFTPEQKERFIEHLSGCHSWHKHLSLVTGGKFILFLDEQAGLDYPSQHPVLPFGNSPEDYRKAFGLLNYCWKTEGDTCYQRDDLREMYPEATMNSRFGKQVHIQLFPYLSDNFVEAIAFHQAGFEQIIREKTHEAHERLSRVNQLQQAQLKYWNEILTDQERNAYSQEIADTLHAKEYQSIELELVHELEGIQMQEKEKISNAIDLLLK